MIWALSPPMKVSDTTSAATRMPIGIEPAEKRDGDGGEAIAGRDRGLELADLARHLGNAGEPCETAGNAEDRQRRRLGMKPANRAARGASPLRRSR